MPKYDIVIYNDQQAETTEVDAIMTVDELVEFIREETGADGRIDAAPHDDEQHILIDGPICGDLGKDGGGYVMVTLSAERPLTVPEIYIAIESLAARTGLPSAFGRHCGCQHDCCGHRQYHGIDIFFASDCATEAVVRWRSYLDV